MEQGNNLDKIAYRKLIAWQKADELAFQIYQATKDFPSEEKFGLVSQMRRAAVSVAANIAEGYTRNSKKDKIHFYNIAFGSLTEIEYYLDFSRRLTYLNNDRHRSLVKLREETGRLLTGLTKGTRNKWQGARILLLFFLVPGFLFHVSAASAASLYFSPSSGSHAVGTTLSVSVYVSSADQAMNAASGVISFPSDKLAVESLSKGGSIFSLWVQEPSFSNTAGTINFEGIVLNPGFTGANGKAITITFRTKAAGNAPLTFSSGSALANDGKGTNILANLGNAQFSLGGTGPTVPETTTPSAVSGAPSAPEISSPTHPDQNKWYSKKDAKFTWDLPRGVTAVRLLASPVAEVLPTVTYAPAVNSKEITDLSDGVWYFHLRFRNAAGWGDTSHFRLQVDTTAPDPISIKFLNGEVSDNPRPTVLFDTTDALSGIDYYLIKIGEGDFFMLSEEIVKSNPYTLPVQAPGKRTFIVQAFDRAGNSIAASADFVVKPPPSPLVTTGLKITNLLAIIVPLAALVILLLLLILYGWYKFWSLRKRLRKEVREAESALHKAFDLLKENIREQIKMLEKARTKRQLTEEEEKIVKQLKRDLDDAEKFIRKEIEDIEKEVK